MKTRICMCAELKPNSNIHDDRISSVDTADEDALSRLLFNAYLGTIDQEEDTLEQAHQEIKKTFSGEYGPFDPVASKIFVDAGQLTSAVLITRFQNKPFVAFTLTAPASKGKGLARVCLAAAMSELFMQGEHEVRLVVTVANEPAIRLYTSLGFQPE